MSMDGESSVSIAPAAGWIGLPDNTGASELQSYLGAPTGEGVAFGRVSVDRSLKLTRRPATKDDHRRSTPLPTAEVRRALRRAWNDAVKAADAMHDAAQANDLMAVGIAANDLDRELAELWKLRAHRDIDWQSILNHMQGVMRTFFQEKRAESLTAEQCKALVDLVKDYLGPATKTTDDLNEVLRLIDDAGFDPFAAISADESSANA